MKKSIKIILGITGLSLLALIVVAAAGMYKFNYLASQPGYDVDGNKIEEAVSETETEFEARKIVTTDYRELPEREASAAEVVGGLDAPWAFVWLPSGDVLVTERFGTLRMIRDGVLLAESVAGVPEVFSAGQGGLLDVTVHPEFDQNRLVYLSYAHGTNEGNRLRVARAELRDMKLENLEVIFEVGETKTGSQHFGSRFAWLPDGTLLFSVGDGGNPPTEYNGELIREQAQNLSAHLGKIIRINDDGTIPNDNPFVGRPDVNPEIYSFGHRNVQGITYDQSSGRVLASEHGSKGGDELNSIEPGANYGWPLATFSTEYDAFSTAIAPTETAPEFIDPIAAWTPTVAPSAVVAYTGERYDAAGDVFMAAMLLRSNTTIAAYAFSPAGSILRLITDEVGGVTGQERISLGDVRVRSIGQGPDGYLYALTDTTDRQSRPGMNAGALVRIESF